MKNVLLFTGLKEGYYFEPFLKHCRNSNIFIFDPDHFPTNLTFDLGSKASGEGSFGHLDVFYYQGNLASMSITRISHAQIDKAWYLRENPLSSEKNKNVEERFRENESRSALEALYSSLHCEWINKKSTIDFISNNKFYQQEIARKAGLIVPETHISNDPKVIQTFSKQKSLLIKPMGYIKFDEKGKLFLYAQRFEHHELEHKSRALRMCPVFAQEYVEKLVEHRIMVIGKEILSCSIDSQASERTKTDWRRYDFDNVAHAKSELPKSVQDALFKFMQMIGLQYGAIDMIETKTGDFVFLEVNPSGQWGWIAEMAKLPIAKSVARLLDY